MPDQPEHQAQPAPALGASLGPMLEPVLAQSIKDQGHALSPIQWFRSDHQRGGGSTGMTVITTPQGQQLPAVVKLPVGPVEYRWTCALGRDPLSPTPRLIAAGSSLAGYDLAWLIIEKIPGSTVGKNLDRPTINDLLRACAHMQARCEHIAPINTPSATPHPAPKPLPFEQLIEKSREVARRGSIADAPKWAHELREVSRALPSLIHRWDRRQINSWCHGDLHGGNAIRTPDNRLVLIDLALVHTGHWLEDALYLERVCWARTHLEAASADKPAKKTTATDGAWHGQHFGDRHAFSHTLDHPAANDHHQRPDKKSKTPASKDNPSLLSQLATFRRDLGLVCDDDYGTLANIRRVLMAACAPAWIEREGSPAHLAHALTLLQKLLPQVGRA